MYNMTKLYHLEQSQLRDQFSINESGELTNHIDLEVETARDGIAWSRVKKYLIILLLCITFLPL